MRVNTQNTQQRGQETRGMREGSTKHEGTDIRRSVEGRGMGQGTQGKQDGHYMDFQVLTRQGLSGRKAGNLKEVGLGGLSGVEKIEDLDGG